MGMALILSKRNDVWLDNGILQVYSMIKNIMFRYEDIVKCRLEADSLIVDIMDEDKFKELFTQQIFLQLDNILLKVQDEKGIEKRVIKEHVLLQYGKKVDGQNTVGEKLFDIGQTSEIVKAFINQKCDSKKKQTCLLCGQEYDSSIINKLKINTIKQAVYPLSTKNSAISHIRTVVEDDGYESG